VANRSKGRRGRARKRDIGARAASARPTQAGQAGAGEDEVRERGRSPAAAERGGLAPPAAKERGRSPGAAERGGRSSSRAASRRARADASLSGGLSAGQRPKPPWYPLPLSELLILVGIVGTVVGLRRGISGGGPVLFAGLAAVMLGTAEVTLREHLSGYRSHTLLLALLPTVVFHAAVVLIVAAFTPVPRALNVALLPVDAALFAFLFKVLRARFIDARRERISTGRG
jgi:hypothetical protein